MATDQVRINAFLALCGLGSRRSVESLIEDGKVSVNGHIVRDFSVRINVGKDRVLCAGKQVQPQLLSYIMLNKPEGFACTRDDPHASKTIYDLLPKNFHHLVYAGRLDVESEGMVILSNDGGWIQGLSHPRNEVTKYYNVTVTGVPTLESIKAACRGIVSRDETLKFKSARIIRESKRSSMLRVELQQGKNREIRRVFSALGHSVLQLERIGIGKLRLDELKSGQWRKLTSAEIESLRKN